MTQESYGRTKGDPATVLPSDNRRSAAHAEAAGDPEIVMVAVQAAFTDLHRLTKQGEREAAAGAAAVVASGVLQLCTIPATSSVQADNKVRFLTIIARWSLSRDPRLTAVLQASLQQERRRWGLDDADL